MNCPNCGKQPMGFTHFFKGGGLGFTKNILGYFKCQHCDSLLKYQRHAWLMVKYDFRFYLIVLLMIAIAIYLPDPLTTLLAVVIILISMDKFAKFELADESDLAKEENLKINTTGWIILTVFLIVYLLAGLLLFQNIDMLGWGWDLNNTLMILYIIILLGSTSLLVKKYSYYDSEDSEQDAVKK